MIAALSDLFGSRETLFAGKVLAGFVTGDSNLVEFGMLFEIELLLAEWRLFDEI